MAPPLPNKNVSATTTAPPGLASVWRATQLNEIFLSSGKGREEKNVIISQALSGNVNKLLMANFS